MSRTETPSRPDRWAYRIVGLAVAVLPADQRLRYSREFIAELAGLSRRHQRRHATQVLTHAWALRAALVAAAPTNREDTMTTTARKPLRCRLGLHRWDDRENPETHEHYQICLRCDAYHEKPQAAPGAGAAGVTGAGIF